MSDQRGPFDRLADWVAAQVAHAWFFALCLGVVVGWCAGLPFYGVDNELWHLALNSPTTGITFLLVALLHNGQHRFETATNLRFQELLEKLEPTVDPVTDEGQKPS